MGKRKSGSMPGPAKPSRAPNPCCLTVVGPVVTAVGPASTRVVLYQVAAPRAGGGRCSGGDRKDQDQQPHHCGMGAGAESVPEVWKGSSTG